MKGNQSFKGRDDMGEPRFYNLSERNMDFEMVFERIYEFITVNPANTYRLSIGTDSQAHQFETRFITAIHLHRVGKGAWGCLQSRVLHRKVESLREKIQLETYYSQQTAYLFTPDHFAKLIEVIYPYQQEGGTLSMEIHLDIGHDGLTREFIMDMTARITSMGLTPRIKPDSYTAFSYANRYTK